MNILNNRRFFIGLITTIILVKLFHMYQNFFYINTDGVLYLKQSYEKFGDMSKIYLLPFYGSVIKIFSYFFNNHIIGARIVEFVLYATHLYCFLKIIQFIQAILKIKDYSLMTLSAVIFFSWEAFNDKYSSMIIRDSGALTFLTAALFYHLKIKYENFSHKNLLIFLLVSVLSCLFRPEFIIYFSLLVFINIKKLLNFLMYYKHKYLYLLILTLLATTFLKFNLINKFLENVSFISFLPKLIEIYSPHEFINTFLIKHSTFIFMAGLTFYILFKFFIINFQNFFIFLVSKYIYKLNKVIPLQNELFLITLICLFINIFHAQSTYVVSGRYYLVGSFSLIIITPFYLYFLIKKLRFNYLKDKIILLFISLAIIINILIYTIEKNKNSFYYDIISTAKSYVEEDKIIYTDDIKIDLFLKINQFKSHNNIQKAHYFFSTYQDESYKLIRIIQSKNEYIYFYELSN